MNPLRPSRPGLCTCLLCLTLVALVVSAPLIAKTTVDFNPNLDFSKYKTFAFIGGVENLLMLQLDPDVMDNHIHHQVSEQLAKKGLHEVQPNQNPDLVVRYWANPSQQVNVTTMGNWAPYFPYINSDWAWVYDDVAGSSSREGCLIVDFIEPKSRVLAWRLYLVRKIVNSEKDWRKTDEDLAKAFESYPPSDNDKDAKKKERAAHSSKSQ